MSEAPAEPGERSLGRVDLIRALAVLAEPPGDGSGRVAAALGLERAPSASEYADVFLFNLYPYASVYLGPEGMIGGEARDRVAGFWRALALSPPAEPDHLAALLGLYASLTERERGTDDASGLDAGGPDAAERLLLSRARATLLLEHLEPWVFAFLERVNELSPMAYGAWAALLADVLRAEVEAAEEHAARGQPPTASVHLREAPPLPDPRIDGGAAFLGGLLAPVRTGAILTRADLARISGDAEIGLRAGERRYVLEHLLAQDAPAVLTGIAAEFRRQSAGHRERVSSAADGRSTAAFFAARALAAAELVEDLAAAGAEAAAGAGVG